jgi:hypothetical protein
MTKAASGASSAILGQAVNQLNRLAAQNPDDKDLTAAVDALNTTLDAKGFAENPTGFLAGKAKDSIVQGVFKHFAESLAKTRGSFESRFPSVRTLQQDPLGNGVSLAEYEKRYREALAALRVPAGRRALLYVAVLLGLPADAPAEEVQRRIGLANRELAKLPGVAQYVAKYYDARDRYAFTIAAMTNDISLRHDGLATLPAGLVDDLHRRSGALNQIGGILDRTQQDLWESGLVIWAPVLGVAQDLESLAHGFQGLGHQLEDFAALVGSRGGEYSRELARLEAEAHKVELQSTRAFTAPAQR